MIENEILDYTEVLKEYYLRQVELPTWFDNVTLEQIREILESDEDQPGCKEWWDAHNRFYDACEGGTGLRGAILHSDRLIRDIAKQLNIRGRGK